jgi:hypothetical protein
MCLDPFEAFLNRLLTILILIQQSSLTSLYEYLVSGEIIFKPIDVGRAGPVRSFKPKWSQSWEKTRREW